MAFFSTLKQQGEATGLYGGMLCCWFIAKSDRLSAASCPHVPRYKRTAYLPLLNGILSAYEVKQSIAANPRNSASEKRNDSRLIHLFFEEAQILSISLFFHIFQGDEAKRGRIYTVAKTPFVSWSIVEQMP